MTTSLNLSFEIGETWEVFFSHPQALQPPDARWRLGTRRYAVSMEVILGGQLVSSPGGYTLAVTPAMQEAAGLTPDVYLYELRITLDNGTTETIFAGSMEVAPSLFVDDVDPLNVNLSGSLFGTGTLAGTLGVSITTLLSGLMSGVASLVGALSVGNQIALAATMTARGLMTGAMQSATYLPTVATAPSGAYGVKKLIQSYSGSALRVRRISDSVEQDIGFVGPDLDVAAATTFAGASSLRVTTWYDQTGNTRHLTQPTTGLQPILWLGSGGPSITSQGTSKPLLIPTSLSIARDNCSIFMTARNPSQGLGNGMFTFGTSPNDNFGLRSYALQYNMQPIVNSTNVTAGTGNFGAVNVANDGIIAAISSSTDLTVHRDEQTVVFPAASALTLNAGGEVGATWNIISSLDMTSFVIYPAALASGSVTSVKDALKAIANTVGIPTRSILASGDSIVFGTGASNNRTITAELSLLTGTSTLMRNIGVAGQRAVDNSTKFDTNPTRFTSPGVQNIFFANYGHNDIYLGGVTLADIQTAIRHYVTTLRSGAGFDLIGWQTVLADGRGTWTSDMETLRQQLNTWLKSSPVDENGVLMFNFIDDVAGDASFILSDAEFAAGRGMADTALSADNLHPNEVTAPARAAHVYAAINAAIATPLGIGGTPVTAATQGSSYTGFTVAGHYGTAPYTYSVAAGTLPAGITLNASTGVVSGTPTTVGTSSGIVIRVTDAASATANLAAFSITVTAAATGLVLDGITATPYAAYGLRKLRSAYAGSAIKVRRSSDSTTLDIGFDGSGNLNTAALATFVGAGNGFIDTWYDQSTNARHVTQATTTIQPRIVSAGVLDVKNSLPAVFFTTTSPGLTGSLTGAPTSNTRTVAMVISHNSATSAPVLFTSTTGGYILRIEATHTVRILRSGTVIATSTGAMTSAQLATVYASYDGSAYNFSIDNASSGSGTSANTFVAGAVDAIGTVASTSFHLSELLIFDGTLISGSDKSTIQTSQKNYFGTP